MWVEGLGGAAGRKYSLEQVCQPPLACSPCPCTQSKSTKSNTFCNFCLGFVKNNLPRALWRCRFGELKLVQKHIALRKILMRERKDLNRSWEYFSLQHFERSDIVYCWHVWHYWQCVVAKIEICRVSGGEGEGGGTTKADPPGRHRLLYSYLGHVGTCVQNFTFLTMSWTEIGVEKMQYS